MWGSRTVTRKALPLLPSESGNQVSWLRAFRMNPKNRNPAGERFAESLYAVVGNKVRYKWGKWAV